MKKPGIPNRHLAGAVAELGHGDTVLDPRRGHADPWTWCHTTT